ncbi:sugar phosphate isomerase/epimerase family protein [Nocardioides acrostichi]|uniref:Sugar phosphate isomerase/epimerase n=1 Tax=Nocardioides acrostichi TaxID=2784339 RepID=A0A930V2H0_9ACTN|nr:sugar phosphate isomerase/epimerase [Nocardioides acrostichi]MBF4162676.1 sugar phosphate isomerase/epimerase [Nocardioides acrostichi]
MKIGVYNAVLHDRSLEEALTVVEALGLDGVELNTGGFLPPVHVPDLEQMLVDDASRDRLLGVFAAAGLEILGLNCNGNPLHPDPAIGTAHAADVERAVRLAHRLGQRRVVTMSGLPGAEPGATRPSWVVNAWNSAALDVLEFQWEVAEPFWRRIDALARDLDVTVALELHPQNLVFNPASFLELRERIGATNLGVELDASHLFWQQMDPVAVIEHLGSAVVHAAAKDVRVNEHAAINGVLDNSFVRLAPDEPRVNLGGDEWANRWPSPSAWDFVAVGRGHDVDYWARFLAALHRVDPGMIVNIEHEDTSLGPIEGLQEAAGVLLDAASRAGVR